MNSKTLALAIACALGCTTAAWAAPALPSIDPAVRADQQNRTESTQQTELAPLPEADKLQGEMKFTLHKFVFSGDEVITAEELDRLTADYLDQEVTLSDLQEAVDKITAYCRSQGYAAASAFLPPQQIAGGQVEVRIFLGKLGQVKIDNQSRLADSKAQAFAAPLPVGGYLRGKTAETVLNNLNDLPGIAAAGVLHPGSGVGETYLTITLADTKQTETMLYADNYGGSYSGRYRYGFQTTFDDLGRSGDKLYLGGMLTNGDTHNYNLGYETAVGSRGSRLGVSYSLMDYSLGDYFNILDAVGKARTFSIYGSTPLINSGGDYLAAVYGYANRQLQDEMRLFGFSTKKHSNALNAGISGRSRRAGSYTGYSALYYWGQLTNEDFTGAGEGSFQKFTTDVSHLRRLGNSVDLQLNFHGQLGSKELDSSEQFYLGGANGVRAYPQGEAGGDGGYQATAELRCHTPVPNLTLAAYTDWGEVYNHSGVDPHRNLAGWGVGVQYAESGSYYLRLDYARKINSQPYQGEEHDKNGRLWFQAVKIF
ncbi:ShlB/FhaC/HecB family hemolysin secretion/activation protein [uncultured Phascolarctobacterium sp.]|uniref:ShlB/FhaC/HecB family hemolysin secretion/activation protein n=1 Tax=uncultured Phascolarctobacterium sp. TaxID=512296 RepID=UPI0025D481E3|nr:ShlB/FhaC/HecB family hemolysin secretion/activation protein [uncultured Phascolarctobacterium sp.]